MYFSFEIIRKKTISANEEIADLQINTLVLKLSLYY